MEREGDISLLINRFLEEFCGVTVNYGIEEEAVSVLLDYHYPGNIRELRSILQSAVNLAQGKPISTNFIPGYLRKRKPRLRREPQTGSEPIVPLEEMDMSRLEKPANMKGDF